MSSSSVQKYQFTARRAQEQLRINFDIDRKWFLICERAHTVKLRHLSARTIWPNNILPFCGFKINRTSKAAIIIMKVHINLTVLIEERRAPLCAPAPPPLLLPLVRRPPAQCSNLFQPQRVFRSAQC